MAKFGEGDPRWIVQERQDGQNVNAWHWEEKDVTIWSKGRLKELLEKQTITETAAIKCKTTWLDKFEGDVTLYNRKGKICFVMELNLSVFCEGQQVGSDGTIISEGKGKLEVAELEHDSDPAKVKVKVDVTCDTKDKSLSRVLQTEGVNFMHNQLSLFFKDLQEGQKVQNKSRSQVGSPSQQPVDTVPQNVDVAEFVQTLLWRVPTAELWDCLVNESKISAYTRSPATVSLKTGGEFTFLNKSITGTFTFVEPEKSLKMKWRIQDWPQGVNSDVTITFTSDEQGTTDLCLVQTGVPKNDLERTKQGWQRNFWEPIKMIFGYGYEMK